jgi:hypothetical protein
MPVIDLFNFVVDQNIADEDVDAYLEKVSCMTLPFNLSLLLLPLEYSHNDPFCMIDGNCLTILCFNHRFRKRLWKMEVQFQMMMKLLLQSWFR